MWGQSDLVLKVKEPVSEEYRYLRPGLVLFTYLHLAANEPLTRALVASGARAVGYETVQLDLRGANPRRSAQQNAAPAVLGLEAPGADLHGQPARDLAHRSEQGKRSVVAGYDLKKYAEGRGAEVQQELPWDPLKDYRFMKQNTDDFFSLWRSYKPTICKVQGYAVAGGSDIALCCDLVIMADDARIGYMPARVWGCPTTAMWVFRLGAEKAKRILLTGDTIDGRTAAAWGLVYQSVPLAELDAAVDAIAERMASVPKNQLMMQKLMINQAYENMGLSSTQMLATFFDGIARHSPEGFWFKRQAEQHGFHAAVEWRDSGRPIPEGGVEEERKQQVSSAGQTPRTGE